jgi:hypothetical protein
MNTRILMTLAMYIGAVAPLAAGEEFVRGQVYMSIAEGEGCKFFGQEWIYRYDPVTGETSILTDFDDLGDLKDGICNIDGLRFTPDGKRLLAINRGFQYKPYFALGSVLSFDANGGSEVLLDEEDGIRTPWGANGLAFDARGDLYVRDSSVRILRFPVEGGPFTVFADGYDGIFQRGSIDFSPDGDIYCAGAFADTIVRITPEGEGFTFDALPGADFVAFDSHGNLFVLTGQTLYQYVDGDPNQLRTITSDFVLGIGSPTSMAVSNSGDVVYVGSWGGLLYRVDVCTKSVTVVADLFDIGFFPRMNGMIIYEPLALDDFDGDGDVDIRDFGRFSECASTGSEPMTPGCLAGDSDGDGDVDFVDFGAFQRRFTGAMHNCGRNG